MRVSGVFSATLLAEPTITEHYGRLIKTTGDGFVAISTVLWNPYAAASSFSKTCPDSTPG